MRMRFIVSLTVAFVFCMALVGCGGSATSAKGSASTSASENANSGAAGNAVEANSGFYGYWRMVSEKDGGETFIDAADMDVIQSLGFDCFVGINKDGTCSWVYATTSYDSKLDITDSDTIHAVFKKSNESTVKFDATLTLDGDKLAITVGDGVYTFERISPDDFPADAQKTRDAYVYQSWLANGNAVIELSGEELNWLLYCLDYTWDEKNTARCHQSFGTASLSIMGSGGAYASQDEMRELQAGAQGNPYVFALTSTEFTSAEETFEICFGKRAAESASSDRVFVSTVSDSAGNDYLVLITSRSEKGLYSVTISGKDGLGVLEEILGDTLGGSVAEAYANLAEYINSL